MASYSSHPASEDVKLTSLLLNMSSINSPLLNMLKEHVDCLQVIRARWGLQPGNCCTSVIAKWVWQRKTVAR